MSPKGWRICAKAELMGRTQALRQRSRRWIRAPNVPPKSAAHEAALYGQGRQGLYAPAAAHPQSVRQATAFSAREPQSYVPARQEVQRGAGRLAGQSDARLALLLPNRRR